MKSKILIIITLFLVSCTQPKFDERYVDIDFKDLTVDEFLKIVSKVTDRKIVVNEKIDSKTNFLSNEPLLKTDLIPLANAILNNNEMLLVNKGDHYIVMKLSDVVICGYNYVGVF
jgi:general secretion pathway protein D